MCASATVFAGYPNIIYTAVGTFGNPISGSDTFRLAGEPFSLSILANDSQLSSFHGPTYAGYSNLLMSGTLNSHLIQPPISIYSRAAWVVMANGNPNHDQFTMGSPVRILSLTLSFTANITLPKGALTTVRNHVFPPVPLAAHMATVTYSDGTNSTTLGLSGTLSATAAGTQGTRAGAAVPRGLYARAPGAAIAEAAPAAIRRQMWRMPERAQA
ncbi:MAG TPA: hypothetical protein VMG35_08520 [Bryobacteraceae bacterium]|nr:hypothetical protein [Bryobacteraceae bacterium]